MQRESIIQNLKQEKEALLQEITNLHVYLAQVDQSLSLLSGGPTTTVSIADVPNTVQKAPSRVEQAFSKKQKLTGSGKKTLEKQIIEVLSVLKHATKGAITEHLLNAPERKDMTEPERKKFKHIVTVTTSRMLGANKLDIKGKDKRSNIYMIPKVAKKDAVEKQVA
jgi:hypothetical protein